MSNRSLTAALATTLVLAATAPVGASAQVLNMDMSWAIQSQMQNQAYAQAAAQAAAMNYLRYMQQLRAMGYTGPSLPTGVTSESLRQSINGMNEAWSSYNRAQSVNSQRLSNSVNNYVMQGIRGCSLVNYYGRPTYVCP